MHDGEAVATKSAALDLVRAIWLEVLGIGEAGEDEDFFYLGGDSLSGLEVIERVYSQSGIDIPAMAMYDRVNTIRKMAEWIENGKLQ